MLNFSTNKNMVDKLPEGIPLLEFETTGVSSTRSVAIEGQPYGVLYGSRFLRNESNEILVGDDGYPLVNVTAGVVGDPNHRYTMGITNTFSYKGLVIQALIDIKQGGQMYNGTRNVMRYLGTHKSTENREEDYIFPGVNVNTGQPNDVIIKRDATYYSRQGTLAGLSEAGIEDASLIRLRHVNILYNLPAKWFVNSAINRIEVGLSGRNLILVTDYSGIDPETNLSGTSNSLGRDYYNMPNTRGIEFNLSVTF
jgi:hypothetical protein